MKQSYVEINSEHLQRACEFGLESIKKMRERKIEEFIDYLTSKRFFKSKTREDALEKIKDDLGWGFSQYDEIMEFDCIRNGICESLKGMAQLDSKVYLSRSDYEYIERYINETL